MSDVIINFYIPLGTVAIILNSWMYVHLRRASAIMFINVILPFKERLHPL